MPEGFNLWCKWCVDRGRFIPFEECMGFVLPIEMHEPIMEAYEQVRKKNCEDLSRKEIDLLLHALEAYTEGEPRQCETDLLEKLRRF